MGCLISTIIGIAISVGLVFFFFWFGIILLIILIPLAILKFIFKLF